MNFALILFILVIATGIVWCFDHFWARKKRAADAPDPWWVEYGGSFFPVILAVFLLRSFLVEPFKIPSGSMIPTLLVGDFILVNKYTYGVRLPVLNKKVVELNSPQRGDVVVFRLPRDPSQTYIKRVIGLPGDRVQMIDGRLWINGRELPLKADGMGNVEYEDGTIAEVPRYIETLPDGVKHPIFKWTWEGPKDNTETFVVPPGYLFMMGDNRDNSQDSRWSVAEDGVGYVPMENLVGRAEFVVGSYDFLNAHAIWSWLGEFRLSRMFNGVN